MGGETGCWLPTLGGWKADEVTLDPALPMIESDRRGEVADEAVVDETVEAAMHAAAAAAAVLPKIGLKAPAAAAENGSRGSMKW